MSDPSSRKTARPAAAFFETVSDKIVKVVRYVDATAEKVPTVDLTVRGVPKSLLDFVDKFLAFTGYSREEFWRREIVGFVDCILDNPAVYVCREALIKHHSLKEALAGDC